MVVLPEISKHSHSSHPRVTFPFGNLSKIPLVLKFGKEMKYFQENTSTFAKEKESWNFKLLSQRDCAPL